MPYPTRVGFFKEGSGNFSAPVSHGAIEVEYNDAIAFIRGFFSAPISDSDDTIEVKYNGGVLYDGPTSAPRHRRDVSP